MVLAALFAIALAVVIGAVDGDFSAQGATLCSPPMSRVWHTLPGQSPYATVLAANRVVTSIFQDGGPGILTAYSLDGKVCEAVDVPALATADAFDATSGMLYATVLVAPEIIVLDPSTLTVVKRVTVSDPYLYLTVDEGVVYASRAGKPLVDVLDVSSWQVTSTVQTSDDALRVLRVGDRAYAACGRELNRTGQKAVPGRIDVIDLTSTRVTSTITLSGAYPAAMAYDGARYIYVAPGDGQCQDLQRVDVSTNSLDADFAVPISGTAYDLKVDALNGLVYVACDGFTDRVCVVSIPEKREVTWVWGGYGRIAAERNADGAISRLWVPNPPESVVTEIDCAALRHRVVAILAREARAEQ